MKKLLIIFLVLITSSGFSQQKKIIYDADLQFVDEEKYPGATVLIGNVKMIHAGAILTSQKAFYYKKENFFKAIGNVIINQGDTVKQYSNYVDYDANFKKSVSWGSVVLEDPTMTLTTDTLYFNRASQLLFYKDHAVIKDETNVLESKNGNYYLKKKKFTATTKVTVTNPDNIIASNHLDYYTNSGHAFLYGPSTITNQKDNNKIYSERGFYNTKTDISHFVKNAKLYLDDRTIEGDSLYYDKVRGFASATNNIKVIDTAENFMARGNYAEYFQKKDSIYMIKRAVAISVVENDSTFIHGDTLLVTGKKEHRIIRSYNNVKIFKLDLQGKCDSLHTNQSTGITKMYVDPILWSEKSQITGDSIKLLTNTETEKLDSLKILGNSFIIQKDSIDPEKFNQIKGRNMYGKFIDNQLKTLLVKGNGEAINFNRNDEGVLETITKQYCSNIEFDLLDSEINEIKCLNMSDGKTYPPSLYPENEKRLKGFIWRESEQPKTKEDIFLKNSKSKVNKNNKENQLLGEVVKVSTIGDSRLISHGGSILRNSIKKISENNLLFVGSLKDSYGHNHDAIGGDGSPELMARYDDIPDADVYVILFGTNDLWMSNIDLAFETLSFIVDDKLSKGAKVFYCKQTPRDDDADILHIELDEAMYNKFNGVDGFDIIDLRNPLLNKDGSFNPSLYKDHVHPNNEGGRIMGRVIANKIDETN